MSEMLMRVGAAILEAESRWTPKAGESKERVMALAAFEAMRAPSEAMLVAGQTEIYIERNENPHGPHTYASRDETEDAWQAMIDEALKP